MGVDELLRALPDDLVLADVSDGQVVIRAGEPSSGLVRVVSGTLDVDVVRGRRSIRVQPVGPGAVLGGVGLLAGGASTATVTARGPAVVEVLSAEVARAHLDTHPQLATELAAQVRSTIDRDALLLVLAELLGDTHADLPAVSRRLRVRTVPGGGLVCRQGDDDTTAYIVVAGRLSIRTEDEDGPTEVTRVGRGQVIGERALLTGEPRDATVVAVRDTVLAEVGADDFHALLVDHPAIARELMRQVALRRTNGPARRREVATVAVASASTVVDAASLVADLGAALAPMARVRHLSAAEADEDLATPAASAASAGPAASRLAAYLHEQEATADVVLLEVGPAETGWDHRAVRVADRVAVLLDADAPEAQRARVRALVAAVPDGVEVIALLRHGPDVDRPRGTAALRTDLGVHQVLHLRTDHDGDLARAARLVAGRGVALVLGGGGAKGYAHIGVQRAMTDLGIPIDLVAGASMGALLGAAIASDLSPEELPEIVARLSAGGLDYTLPVTSLIKGERIARALTEQFGDWDLEDLWIPFACVSTDLTDSCTMVHTGGPLVPMLRATSAIPGVMPPVPFGEHLLVDGGVLDNLPVDAAAEDGRCSTIIAVDVAPPHGPRATSDFGLSVSGWKSLRASVGKGRSEYPGIAAILMRSMIVGSMVHRRRSLDEVGVSLLLELHVRGVSLLDLEVVDPVVQTGYELALPELEAWLATSGWPAGR